MRYQCPLCGCRHTTENTPRCPIHGSGSARNCAECVRVFALIPCRRTT
jgi:hypothetical protein